MSKKQRKNADHGPQEPYRPQPYQPGADQEAGQWQPGAPAVPPAPGHQQNWFMRHKVISGLGALAAIVVIGTAATSGGSDGQAEAATTAPAATASASVKAPAKAPAATKKVTKKATAKATHTAQQKKGPGIGDPVRDGKFEFTVTKVERGVGSVGEDFLAEKAQGSFTLVHLTVKNIGDRQQAFFDDNQKVLDNDGRQFGADSSADMAVPANDNVLFEEINPGNSIQGVLVFDLPKGTTAESMELHDSMFSGGVKVQLR